MGLFWKGVTSPDTIPIQPLVFKQGEAIRRLRDYFAIGCKCSIILD